jgi:hypothetical protein
MDLQIVHNTRTRDVVFQATGFRSGNDELWPQGRFSGGRGPGIPGNQYAFNHGVNIV